MPGPPAFARIALCARIVLSLVAAALLPACGEGRPDGVPRPVPGPFSFLDSGCPDLTGHYRLADGDGRRLGFPGRDLSDAMKGVPRYHSVWSIESLDAQRLVMRSDAGATEMARAFARWRHEESYQFRLWHAETPLAAPERFLPRTRQYTLSGLRYRCEDGWLVTNGLPEPDADDADQAEVRITRAADGGLVGVRRFRERRSFSVWCGDGCKPAIPLPDAHRQLWWHAPPATPADDAAVDWAQLLANDPGPPAERKRGWRRPDTAAGDAGSVAATAAGARVPMAVEVPSPAALLGPSAAASWQQRLSPLLPAGTRLDPVDCDGTICNISGSAVRMADVSDLLRAIDAEGAGVPELEIIEAQPDARFRFRIVLTPLR